VHFLCNRVGAEVPDSVGVKHEFARYPRTRPKGWLTQGSALAGTGNPYFINPAAQIGIGLSRFKPVSRHTASVPASMQSRMFLDSIVFFKLVFSQHFVQDAVEIAAIIGGEGKNIPKFFYASGVDV